MHKISTSIGRISLMTAGGGGCCDWEVAGLNPSWAWTWSGDQEADWGAGPPSATTPPTTGTTVGP